MHIGMISQWYDPEPGSAAVPASISRALRDHGHEVSVVTGFPNYPTGRLNPDYPLRLYRREWRDGICVHRAPLYPSHDARPVRRAANFLSFAASASAVSTAALKSVDATLVYSTPATVALPAMTLRLVRGRPFVLFIQDLWPQTVTASGFIDGHRAGYVERVLHKFCDATYRQASAVAVTSPGMIDLIAARGVPREKLHVVTNWADERHFHVYRAKPVDIPELPSRRRFTAMYAGNLGDVQGVNVIVDAATLLRDNDDIGFMIVGGGVAESDLKHTVLQRGLRNVTFLPPQPLERMAGILALGDVQLITLRDRSVFESVLPSKVQATLASGRPVIGQVAGDAAAVIKASGAGPIVRPGSGDELAKAILSASKMHPSELQARGAQGREFYVRELSSEAGIKRLSQLLEAAAGVRRVP
jgi:colanic acid biosynthesis glycosyl transferase WcaI